MGTVKRVGGRKRGPVKRHKLPKLPKNTAEGKNLKAIADSIAADVRDLHRSDQIPPSLRKPRLAVFGAGADTGYKSPDTELQRWRQPSPIPGFEFNGITRRWQPLGDVDSPADEKQVGGQHYKNVAIQPWNLAIVNGLPYLDATAIIYLMRWRYKGQAVKDLEKVIHYCEKMIEVYQAETSNNGNVSEADNDSPA